MNQQRPPQKPYRLRDGGHDRDRDKGRFRDRDGNGNGIGIGNGDRDRWDGRKNRIKNNRNDPKSNGYYNNNNNDHTNNKNFPRRRTFQDLANDVTTHTEEPVGMHNPHLHMNNDRIGMGGQANLNMGMYDPPHKKFRPNYWEGHSLRNRMGGVNDNMNLGAGNLAMPMEMKNRKNANEQKNHGSTNTESANTTLCPYHYKHGGCFNENDCPYSHSSLK
ncbi:hypothetical protein RFI_13499 [Reticulomyxa filosa]|uniref:C3H1-type domain-containing protein n=1 Tax=Reticulomyxa filosa TaxID=46433 RepID=X6ND33_RETFI|nr:hypothetical protein RFI_13499 [Reticulomyxa filosa]|eukprot:ETO23684.1 hypothetical protein RFI_13499 [Reticulomyxa filosa]